MAQALRGPRSGAAHEDGLASLASVDIYLRGRRAAQEKRKGNVPANGVDT